MNTQSCQAESPIELQGANSTLRLAQSADAEIIHRIATQSFIGATPDLHNGFLLFPLSVKCYAYLAENEHPIVVCLDTSNNINGFICGIDMEKLDELYTFLGDQSTTALLKQINSASNEPNGKDVIILYQMALTRSEQSKGLGSRFFRHYAKMFSRRMYGVVVTYPIRSSRHSFWRALGFVEMGFVNIAAPKFEFPDRYGITSSSKPWEWVLFKREPNLIT